MADLKQAVDIIKLFEGCRLEAYYCPAGVLTIGYGQTVGVKVGDKWTQEQADTNLVNTVAIYASKVIRLVRPDTKPQELCAFISLAYNIGLANFKESSALRYHNAREPGSKVSAGIEMWNRGTVDGKKIVLKGLVRRRRAESILYLTGVVQ